MTAVSFRDLGRHMKTSRLNLGAIGRSAMGGLGDLGGAVGTGNFREIGRMFSRPFEGATAAPERAAAQIADRIARGMRQIGNMAQDDLTGAYQARARRASLKPGSKRQKSNPKERKEDRRLNRRQGEVDELRQEFQGAREQSRAATRAEEATRMSPEERIGLGLATTGTGALGLGTLAGGAGYLYGLGGGDDESDQTDPLAIDKGQGDDKTPGQDQGMMAQIQEMWSSLTPAQKAAIISSLVIGGGAATYGGAQLLS